MGNSILYNTAGSIALAVDFTVAGPHSDKFLTRQDGATVRVNAELFVRVGDAVLCVDTDTDVTAADLDVGSDFGGSATYFVYACHPLDGTLAPVFKISANATYPAGGWNAATSRKIGGFATDGGGAIAAGTEWDLRAVALEGMASNSHAPAHERGGTDEIDGDRVAIDFTPSSYVPDISRAEAGHENDLAAHLAGIDNSIRATVYGVAWDQDADSYARLGALAHFPCGVSPGNLYLPIQSRMRRCVVSDVCDVQYYTDHDDSTKKADGSPADLSGADGQVVVQVPKFYYRYEWAPPVHKHWVSNVLVPGMSVVPAFVKDGVEVDYRYAGAYQGYINGGVLASVSGVAPTGGLTRPQIRAASAARGDGWHQFDWNLLWALQLLYLTEYADLDSQSMISQGNTRYAAWPGVVWVTGRSNGDGNASGGASTSGGAATDYMSYRGIEDWFGGMWQYVDGINVHNSVANGSLAYVAYDWRNFADDTDTNYSLITSDLAQASGYVRQLAGVDGGFFPSSTSDGASDVALCDYYNTHYGADPDSGWRVVLFGGNANNGLNAGAFYVNSNNASSFPHASFGGRLCF